MFEEDFTAFFNTEEHADHIIVQRSGEIIHGIIEKEYIETNDISGYKPVLICQSKELENVKRGDILELGKTLYRFINSEPDGTGVNQSMLELISD